MGSRVMLRTPAASVRGRLRRTPRIAVVGFDGMDAALVRRWAAAGHLPGFAQLLETSAWTQFELPPDYSSGMVWPSITQQSRI